MCEFGMFGPSQAVSVCVCLWSVPHIFGENFIHFDDVVPLTSLAKLKVIFGSPKIWYPYNKELTTTWTKFDHKKGNVTGSKSNLLWENACCSFQLYHWSYCIPGDRDCVNSYTDSLQISDTFDIGAYSISLMLSRRLLKKQDDWDKSLGSAFVTP